MVFIKENLIAEGGGVKGIAFCGALRKLEEEGYLSDFKRFAGSSAGSIVAVALACRMNASQMEDILRKTDFNKFKDDDFGFVSDMVRFIEKYGYYKGDYFRKWYGKLLYEHTGIKHITLKQIHDTYGTEVVVTGTNVNKALTEYYHYSTHPDMRAEDAVRISMSIPFFFQAVIRKHDDAPDDILVDGGMLNNYPVWVYNCDGSLCYYDFDAEYNKHTLGLKLISPNEKKDDQMYHANKDIENIKEFTKTLISAMQKEIDRSHVTKGYWSNTVPINTYDIKTTDFDLSDENKDKLIKSGYDAMSVYLSQLSSR